ncbi:MAG: hypothetical protein CME59_09905 [Halioglobus sp.]|nr:hypothetical protein [Halioglobus sp.]|tara:strand:- start:3824 stop:5074 length:1251 start_codon:yes stop_codon:yes gene_type:complete
MLKTSLAFAVALLLLSPHLAAAVPADEWARFKAEFTAMQARLSALEEENRRLRESLSTPLVVEDLEAPLAPASAGRDEGHWAERVRWKGDFRYRFEDIEQEDRDDRERNRIRARAALIARATDTVEVGLGMASGGDAPVSTNQTLGGGGSTKDLRLDLAYFNWQGIENTKLIAGKFSNPFFHAGGSQLIWDSDFRPEGAALRWSAGKLFANATYNFLESDSREDDAAIWGVQLGARLPIADMATLTGAARYLDVPSEGRTAFDPDDPDFFGNSSRIVGGEEVYAFDYEVMNLSLELGLEVLDMPLSIYADYIENDAADDLDSGYVAGIVLGSSGQRHSWKLRYQYQDVEADATLGLLSDSDFAGGGTDGEGHKLSARYQLDKGWYIAATYFDTRRGVDLGNDVDYESLQLDTGFVY